MPFDPSVNILVVADYAAERAVAADGNAPTSSYSGAVAKLAGGRRRSSADVCRDALAAAEALLEVYDPASPASRDATLPVLRIVSEILSTELLPEAGEVLISTAERMPAGTAAGEPLRRVAAVLRDAGDDPAVLAGYAKYLGVQLVTRTPVVTGHYARRRSEGPVVPYDDIRTRALQSLSAAIPPEVPRWTRLRALADALPILVSDRSDTAVREGVQATFQSLQSTDPTGGIRRRRE